MKVPLRGTNVRRDTPVPGLSMGANWVVPAKTEASIVGVRCRRVLVRAGAEVVSGSGFWERGTSGSGVEALDMGKPKRVRIVSVLALGRGFWLREVGGRSNGD